MVTDRFPPVIRAVSIIPLSVDVSGRVSLSIEATDAARVTDAAGRTVRLRDGKTLCTRRTSMAVDYESKYTGDELDAALDAIAGLDDLLKSVVGSPDDG